MDGGGRSGPCGRGLFCASRLRRGGGGAGGGRTAEVPGDVAGAAARVGTSCSKRDLMDLMFAPSASGMCGALAKLGFAMPRTSGDRAVDRGRRRT